MLLLNRIRTMLPRTFLRATPLFDAVFECLRLTGWVMYSVFESLRLTGRVVPSVFECGVSEKHSSMPPV